jgi:hypothetical protein
VSFAQEFTGYLVQLANIYYQDYGSVSCFGCHQTCLDFSYSDHSVDLQENVPHFRYELVEDHSHHDYPCEFVRYFKDLDRVIVIEQTSRRLKVPLFVPLANLLTGIF